MNKDTKYISVLFAISTTGFFSKFALNTYLAHHLSVSIYGDYSIAISVLSVLSSLVLFGTDVSSQCFLAKYLCAHQKSNALHYIAWNLKLISTSSLIARLVALASIVIMFGLHFFGIREIHKYYILFYVLWITPLAAAFKLLARFLLCTDFVLRMMFLYDVVVYLVEFTLYFMVISVFKYQLNYLMIIAVLGVSYFLLTLLTYSCLNKNVTHMIWQGLNHWTKISITSPIWFAQSSKLIVNSLVFMITSSLDLFIVKTCSATGHHAGQYAAILTIMSFIWLIPNNLYQKVRPMMSNALTTPEGRLVLQARLDQTNKVVFTILSMVTIIIIVFSRPILQLFGENYVQAQPALICLTIGSALSALIQVSGIILIFADFEGLVLRVSAAQLILLLIAAIPATVWFGITGTAVATSLTMFTINLIFVYYTKKKIGLRAIYIPEFLRF